MVEASISLLNSIVIPSLRLTGTSTDPFAGMVEFTWGGVLSGGGSGPSRPHAVSNDAAARTTADRIDGFIPFMLFTYAREAFPMDKYQIGRKVLA